MRPVAWNDLKRVVLMISGKNVRASSDTSLSKAWNPPPLGG